MDSCDQLRRELRDAKAERTRELDLARRRFWLGLLGLDFVLDWQERDAVDRAVAGFLGLVQVGEVVLALEQLFHLLRTLALRTGRTAAAGFLGAMGRRVLGTVALTFLLMDIAIGYGRWTEEERRVERRYRARLGRVYRETDCAERDRIFQEEGVPTP